MVKKDKEVKKKKKKKFKIEPAKILVWFALLIMIGSAILGILSPILYG